MSIRMIAAELYKLQQQVTKLEQTLAATPFEQQAPIQDALRKKRAEYNRMRKVLKGMKDVDRKR